MYSLLLLSFHLLFSFILSYLFLFPSYLFFFFYFFFPALLFTFLPSFSLLSFLPSLSFLHSFLPSFSPCCIHSFLFISFILFFFPKFLFHSLFPFSTLISLFIFQKMTIATCLPTFSDLPNGFKLIQELSRQQLISWRLIFLKLPTAKPTNWLTNQ